MNELTKEQEEYANRLFNLKRRIYDASNIKDCFNHKDVCFPDLSEEVDFDGLSDNDKFILVVIIYDMRDYGVCSHVFKSAFGWDKNKVYAIAKNEASIYSEILWDDDGLIAGKGYVIDQYVKTRMYELYKEFLWHDISEDIPKHRILLFDVDIPCIYQGHTKGCVNDGTFHVFIPEYAKYTELPNWPKEENGWSHKNEIAVTKDNIKRWRFLY